MKYALATVAAIALAAPAFAGDAKSSAPKTVVSTQSGLLAGGLTSTTAIIGIAAVITVAAVIANDSSSSSGT